MTEDALLRSEQSEASGRGGWLDRPLTSLIQLNWETVAWIALLIGAAVVRFYDVGVRAMSHDESLHALYSYYLYDNGNYEHNPMMHGPLLFHINALMYFLFGATDATARIGPVLAGLGTVWMARYFRVYIGRIGALAAGVLIVISPSLLFHSRYIRNDIYIALFTLIWIYGAFRYLDTRQFRYLVVMTLGMAFGFVAKENHFMTGFIIGAFFAGLALWQMVVQGGGWQMLRRNPVADLAVLMLTLVMPFTAPFPFYALGLEQPNWQTPATIPTDVMVRYGIFVVIMTALGMGLAYYWFAMRPQSADASAESENEPTDAAEQSEDLPWLTFGGWARLMGLFWIVAALFFTTFLTNTLHGLATGVVGSLGYWLAQQEVARGGQPWYYYFMLSGLYEFLPWLLSGVGGVVALYWMWRDKTWDPGPAADLPPEVQALPPGSAQAERLRIHRVYFIAFGIWWTLGSWAAYTVAGEKMPWLLTHIALPMCIFGGWYLSHLLFNIDWRSARQKNAIWLIGVTPALIFTLFILLTSRPEFARTVTALGDTMQWLLAAVILAGLFYLIWRWAEATDWWMAARLMGVGLVAVLLLLTVRFSFMLTFINYDMATEYLVYAHGGPDIKRALDEIDKISERTVGGRNIAVAYDDESSWPLSWYMRDYPNSKFYGATPNSDAMSAPVIIVSTRNSEKVRPYVARDYVKRTYRLVWWPDQGYFGLSWSRFWDTLTDPEKMKRVFDIVFYRRYADDANPAVERDLTLWPNRHEFEMYVQRDIAAEIWDLGIAPVTEDPTSIDAQARAMEIDWPAAAIYSGAYGDAALTAPRVAAAGPNGERIIADSGNQRIVVLDRAGNFLHAFGGRCHLASGAESGCVDPDGDGPLELGDGQFGYFVGGDGSANYNDSIWGIAADSAGNIYVSDTWNGRIQMFDSEGNFLRKWGYYSGTNGELGDPYALFGPRGLAVDNGDNLLVADTGNKRIIQFTPLGEALNQIGGGGVIGGYFEEPVGVAVDPNDGSVYVADAWNQRIQKLTPALEFVAEFAVPGWESQQIFHKPFVTVGANGDVYASDPEFVRIYVYANTGELKATFGAFGTEPNQFSLPTGLGFDLVTNQLLVADVDNNRVMAFPPVE